MKRSKFAEERIIGVLREQEAGATTAEMYYRRHGIISATCLSLEVEAWRQDMSDAKRLKTIEDESAKLQRLPCSMTPR